MSVRNLILPLLAVLWVSFVAGCAQPPELRQTESPDKPGGVQYAKDEYAESERLRQRELVVQEKTLGPEHPAVARSLNNLAEVYRLQGRNAEAEPLHKRALAIREKARGPAHPDVATSLNNLALAYDAQGKYAEAEP